jgi:hypothetical protein
MLVADASRVLVLGGLGVLLVLHVLTFPEILVVAVLSGGAGVFFVLAENSALPSVVPAEQLSEAISQNLGRVYGANVVSGPLTGLLYSIARSVPFLVDAVSYAVSFISLLFMRSAFQEARAASASVTIRSDVVEGVRCFWRTRVLRVWILFSLPGNFAFAGLGLGLVVRAKQLGASPTLIGVMFAMLAVSGVVGSLVAPWVARTVRPLWVILGSTWVSTGEMFALVFVGHTLVLGAVGGLWALVHPATNSVTGGRLFPLIPDRLLGRVLGVVNLLQAAVSAIGVLAFGFLLQALGVRASLLAMGVVLACFSVAQSYAPAIRDLAHLKSSSTLLAAEVVLHPERSPPDPPGEPTNLSPPLSQPPG